MKVRKIKLLTSLASLVVVIAVMAVGVWAATEQAVSVSNTVSFTATANVKATVYLSKIGITPFNEDDDEINLINAPTPRAPETTQVFNPIDGDTISSS